MLKAVRFDEVQHKKLLDFVNNYVDDKGKRNDSEAIRFLMQKGLENLNNNSPIEKTIISVNTEQSDINLLKQEMINEISQLIPKPTQPNIEEIKKELYNQILSDINFSTLNNLNSIAEKLSNIQPVIVQQPIQSNVIPINNGIKEEYIAPVKSSIVERQIEIPEDDDFLANLLANANR